MDADAALFEELWSFPIPADLAAWLRVVNGAAADVDIRFARTRGLSTESSSSDDYCLIAPKPAYRNSGWPSDLIPVADDGCGNSYGLTPSPTGDQRWWVAFWDRENKHAYEPRGVDAIGYYVASSLWHFLDGSFNHNRPMSDDDDPFEAAMRPRWPFDREIVAAIDPTFAAYDGPKAPWH